VLDFIQGHPIEQTFANPRILPVSWRLRLFRTVGSAVVLFASTSVIHRDNQSLHNSWYGIVAQLLDLGSQKLMDPAPLPKPANATVNCNPADEP